VILVDVYYNFPANCSHRLMFSSTLKMERAVLRKHSNNLHDYLVSHLRKSDFS